MATLGKQMIILTIFVIIMIFTINTTSSLPIDDDDGDVEVTGDFSDDDKDTGSCTLFTPCQVGSDTCSSCTMTCIQRAAGNPNGYCFPSSTSDAMWS